MQARDVMTKDVITISRDTTVRTIAALMAERRISGLPVVEDGRLIGMVTESDLLVRAKNLDLPTFLPFIGGMIYLENPRKLEEELKKATGVTAEEIMTTKLITVPPDKPLSDIATLMVEEKVNRLPVVENGILLGIITRSNVVQAVARELE